VLIHFLDHRFNSFVPLSLSLRQEIQVSNFCGSKESIKNRAIFTNKTVTVI
jgi:hypothetical protein